MVEATVEDPHVRRLPGQTLKTLFSAPRSWVLPALLVLGVLVRLGYGLRHPPQQPGQDLANPDDYVEIATSVAQSWTLKRAGQPSAYREPAYPVLLGVMFKAFGRSYPVALLTNCGLAAAALLFLALVGRELFGETVSLLATAVSALYPSFIYYAALPVRETAILAVSSAALWTLIRALGRPSAAAFAWAGLAAALCGLTNVTLLPFALVLAPAAVIVLCRDRGPAAWRWSGAYLAVFLCLYSFWPLRNYLVFRAWIPGTTLTAGNILYNYLVVPQELGGTPEESRIRQADPVFQAAALMPPAQAERHFRAASLDWIRSHPGTYLKLVSWRFFWDEWRLWPRPQAAGESYRTLRWVGLLTNGWIIPLGLLGMLLARKVPRALCLGLFVFTIVLTHSLILTMLRYRVPIMPWLILFASLSVTRLWGALRGKPLPEPAA
ncbi:MAG: glycosyltransferase family 39 protein [Elusimicrobia bacterium]|nr:glycosyltransferase family 39 protein [Elusimicrobiota bacterium]